MEEHERKENADQAEPELLYHYTTQEGLLGIIESKCIWATHSRYLNDRSEGQIVARILIEELIGRGNNEAIEQLTGIPLPKDKLQCKDEGVISQGIRIISEITSQNTYVASFSEHGNLLSQWRAYSGESGGFSIGFSREHLETIGAQFFNQYSGRYYSPDSPLFPCQYFDCLVEKQLKEKIRNAVDSYIKEEDEIKLASTERTGCHTPAAIALKHFRNFGLDCAITKDDAFHEEREWRLVFDLRQPAKDVFFRPGRSMLIPYLKIPLTCIGPRIEIKRIYIGPCPNPTEARRSVEMLLRKQDIYCVDVKDSMIPYRNW
jgi:hypothetical protein